MKRKNDDWKRELKTTDFTIAFNDQSYPTNDGSNVLDPPVFYDVPGPATVQVLPATGATLRLWDGPDETTSSTYGTLVLQYSDYIRFLPKTDYAIWVTLGKVTWDVNVKVVNTSGGWKFDPLPPPIIATPIETDEQPYWTSIYTR